MQFRQIRQKYYLQSKVRFLRETQYRERFLKLLAFKNLLAFRKNSQPLAQKKCHLIFSYLVFVPNRPVQKRSVLFRSLTSPFTISVYFSSTSYSQIFVFFSYPLIPFFFLAFRVASLRVICSFDVACFHMS